MAMATAQEWSPREARVRAPDLVAADAWLNTERPLSLRDLRGQVVLLDFWTYCCINCMHVFPDLKYLEEKYAHEPVVVIGVHSGKFDQEKDADNIRMAVLRHNIVHPVAVDSASVLWNAYTVRAWPTFVLIDPLGYVVGTISGEGHRERLDRAIAQLLEEHRGRGTLAEPLAFRPERTGFQSGELEFPGKVLADASRGRLFISDTNHHRIVMTDLDGRLRHWIGSGQVGLRDGPAASARFHQPQGLALAEDGQTLFVADTENHALRAVDLTTMQVRTLAGTGEQSYDIQASGFGPRTPLSSPWDLARVGDQLYIAMAGLHQIWVYELEAQRVRVYAGNGREAGRDGLHRAASFAQPSGLATDGQALYVADAEISTIRALELKAGGRTRTLAGSGGLFDFGQRDGRGEQARFQHPLGVALHGPTLFVADTFNHRIRRIDRATGEVTTWLGTGRPELGTEAEIGLFEPGGLDVAGDTLFIADTNHHRILRVEISTRSVRVVALTRADEGDATAD